MSMRHGAKPPVMLSNTTRMPQLLAVPPTALAVPATGNTVGASHVLQQEKPWKSEEEEVQGELAYLMNPLYSPINEFVPDFQELYVRSRTNNLPSVPEDGNCLYTALLRVHDFHEGEGHYDAVPESDRVESLRIELLRIWDTFDDNKKNNMFVKHFEGVVDYYIVKMQLHHVTDFRKVRDWMVAPNTWGNTLTLELAAIYFDKTIVQLVHMTQNDWVEHGPSGDYLPPLVAQVYNTAENDNSTDISRKSTFWNSHNEYYIIVLSPQKKHYEFYVSNELYKKNTGKDPLPTQPASNPDDDKAATPPQPASSNPYDDKAAKVVSNDDLLLLRKKTRGKQPARFSQASTSKQSEEDSDREYEFLRAHLSDELRRQQELDNRALERSARETKDVAALVAKYDAYKKQEKQLHSQLADEKLDFATRIAVGTMYDHVIFEMQILQQKIIARYESTISQSRKHDRHWLQPKLNELKSITFEPFMHSMLNRNILAGEYASLNQRLNYVEEGLSAGPLPGLSYEETSIIKSNQREERGRIIQTMRRIRDSIVDILREWLSRGHDLIEKQRLQSEIEGWLNKPSLRQNNPPTSQHSVLDEAFENARRAIDKVKLRQKQD